MLLGCCHCPGDQPSVPPSDIASSILASSAGSGGGSGSAGSIIASDSGVSFSTISECNIGCCGNVLPRKYKLTITADLTIADCCKYYSGEFTLHYCSCFLGAIYASDERNPVFGADPCDTPGTSARCSSADNGARFQLTVGCSSQSLVINAPQNGTSAMYSRTGALPCLGSFTLTRVGFYNCKFGADTCTLDPI